MAVGERKKSVDIVCRSVDESNEMAPPAPSAVTRQKLGAESEMEFLEVTNDIRGGTTAVSNLCAVSMGGDYNLSL